MDSPNWPPANPLLGRVQSSRGVWIVVAIAFALSLPAIAAGFSTDDHIAAYRIKHGAKAWSLFAIGHADVAKGVVDGTFPWWTSPHLQVRFLRPLAMLSHVLEFQWWPDAAWAMHLLNGLLYAAMVAIAWALYRELVPRQLRVAALASLMFAIDDGHGVSVGWISGRNTVLASLFVLTAFWLHVRARRRQQRRLLLASAVFTALALASAEAGLSGLGYFVAYALIFEAGGVWKRAASIAPQLIVVACWATLYVAGDFGVRGASLYRDLTSPLVVLSQGVLDLPSWLMSLFGPPGSTFVLMLPENPVRLVALLVCLPLLAAVLRAVPRTPENAFFALGALCCLPPLFTTHPQERLLMTASFGAFGLLSSFIDGAASHAHRFVRGMRRLLIGLHLVLAPLVFLATLIQTLPIEHGAQSIAAAVPLQAPKQVILVNSPLDVLSVHVSTLLAEDPARKRPDSLHQLYAGASTLTARRIDAQTLELTAEDGWGNVALERTFSTAATMPRAGSDLALAFMQVLVRESTADGRPKRVQFRFPTLLEAPDRLWLAWQGNRPVPWQPPLVSETITFPPRFPLAALEL
jgi:hypothetical protein